MPGVSRLLTDERAFEQLRLSLADVETAPELESLQTTLRRADVQLIGHLTEGSTIGTALLELQSGSVVEFGHVVWTSGDAGVVLWQVVEAALVKETWAGDSRRGAKATLLQLGVWDEQLRGFRQSRTSPGLYTAVFSGGLAIPNPAPVPGLANIASVKGSNYPTYIDVGVLGLHHAAVLGTTGTGKTHLVFDLVTCLAEHGSHVLCIDTTGQYRVRFQEPEFAWVAEGEVSAFLAGDQRIGVYTLTGTSDPIDEVNKLVRKLFGYVRALGAAPSERPGQVCSCT